MSPTTNVYLASSTPVPDGIPLACSILNPFLVHIILVAPLCFLIFVAQGVQRQSKDGRGLGRVRQVIVDRSLSPAYASDTQRQGGCPIPILSQGAGSQLCVKEHYDHMRMRLSTPLRLVWVKIWICSGPVAYPGTDGPTRLDTVVLIRSIILARRGRQRASRPA
jgi:hypothetical protein